MSDAPARSKDISALAQHVLPTAATMAGVCLTGIGLVKLIEGGKDELLVDELLAFDSGIFCLAMLFSFCAVQWSGRKGAKTDAMVSLWLFVAGVFMMLGICVVFAFEIH